jgi:hypothetical protein
MAVPREDDRYREAVAANDSRDTNRGVSNLGTRNPKPVVNPFPVRRRGDTAVPGRRDPRDAGGWRDVKKRREGEEMDRLLAETQEREDLDDEERGLVEQEQLRRHAIAQQEAAAQQEAQMSVAGGVHGSGESKVDYRIGVIAMFFMLAMAVIVDGLQFVLQFIPGVGQVIAWLLAFVTGGFYFMWFHLLGVGYMSGKLAPVKLGGILVGSVIELVPIINALPTLTPTVLTLILASRIEDKLKSKNPQAKKKESTRGMKLRPQRISRR